MLLCERSSWLHYSPFCQIKGVALYIFNYSVKDFNLYASIIVHSFRKEGSGVTVQTFRGKTSVRGTKIWQISRGRGIGRGSIQRMINLSFTMYITIDIYLNAYMYNLDSTCQQKLQIPPRNRDVALIMYSWAAPVNKHVLLHDSSTPQRTMRAAVPRSF